MKKQFKADYEEYYRAKRRQKYLDERSAENGDFSYDMLTTDEFSGEDILIYLHYYADISGTDLAEIYSLSQQAISKRIAKIRAKLKKLLENQKTWL